MARAIDVEHLGRDRVICAYETAGLIVDPGPTSSLDTLLENLEDEPQALLLTHIHLDHAGAAGVLCRKFPHLKVYVHERGARHLADPSRLLASAERIYGDQMERLWGEFAPVPEERIADQIHRTGQAIVWTGHREIAEHYWEQLSDAGLTMAPLERD